MNQASFIFRETCRELNLPCWICGGAIDYSVPTNPNGGNRSDESFTKDHYWPRKLRPDLDKFIANWLPAHKLCNERRGHRRPEKTVWIGDMYTGHWEGKTHEESLSLNEKSKKQRKREKLKQQKEEQEKRKKEKERIRKLCRCNDYQCTLPGHSSREPKKPKPPKPREWGINEEWLPNGDLELYQGPVRQERSVL